MRSLSRRDTENRKLTWNDMYVFPVKTEPAASSLCQCMDLCFASKSHRARAPTDPVHIELLKFKKKELPEPRCHRLLSAAPTWGTLGLYTTYIKYFWLLISPSSHKGVWKQQWFLLVFQFQVEKEKSNINNSLKTIMWRITLDSWLEFLSWKLGFQLTNWSIFSAPKSEEWGDPVTLLVTLGISQIHPCRDKGRKWKPVNSLQRPLWKHKERTTKLIIQKLRTAMENCLVLLLGEAKWEVF